MYTARVITVLQDIKKFISNNHYTIFLVVVWILYNIL